MYYQEESTPPNRTDHIVQQQLVLDGTVNLDYADDELPATFGLLTWLKQQLGLKTA